VRARTGTGTGTGVRPSAHVTSEPSGAKPLNPKRNNAECEAKAERSLGCADKQTGKYYWLICCEKKTMFSLKKRAKKYGL
jgi:hypothetical protein